MDWLAEVSKLFPADKPEHFTNFNHCDECAEHDETLRSADRHTISLAELGNPGWDPICFCNNEGKHYYTPAFIRLSITTIDDHFYFEQFLFHLQGDGPNNPYYQSCSGVQRQFLADFIAFMINRYPEQIEANLCSEMAINVHEIWSATET